MSSNNFLQLIELSPSDLKSYDRNKTIFFLNLSPIENHGSHLPLGMDILEGQVISEGVAQKFAHDYPDWKIVFCPPITMGMGLMPGVGSISFKQKTIYKVLVEYLSSLTKKGFKYIFVSGFHGSLRHLVTIDEAIHYINKKYKAKIVSPFGHTFTNILLNKKDLPTKELNKIFKASPGDIHGGMLETSFMLHIRPDLVREYKELNHIDISQKNIFKKAFAFKSALQQGYFGNPAKAEPHIGKLILDDSIDLFYQSLKQAMQDDKFLFNLKSTNYSKYYMRTNFLSNLIIILAMLSGIFAYFSVKSKYSISKK
ncbi:MAG: creatininase family protein [Candidatus Sericytochromatia bacterium]|nr:creatininase family protein [Candidatus Sericytochromatia bacterium]